MTDIDYCTALSRGGTGICTARARRSFVNCEGLHMALCPRHDEQFYAIAVTAASQPDWDEGPATQRFVTVVRDWAVKAA